LDPHEGKMGMESRRACRLGRRGAGRELKKEKCRKPLIGKSSSRINGEREERKQAGQRTRNCVASCGMGDVMDHSGEVIGKQNDHTGWLSLKEG